MVLTERPERDGGGGDGRRVGYLRGNGRQRGQLVERRGAAAHGGARPTLGLRPVQRLLAALLAARLRRHPRAGHARRLLSRIRPGNADARPEAPLQSVLRHHAHR